MEIVVNTCFSARRGGGHLARCRALAMALARRGATVSFLAAGLPEDKRAALSAAGFTCLHEPPVAADWAVIDDYDLSAAHESAIRAWASRIMVFDDFGDRPRDADLVVDIGRDPALPPPVHGDARVLTGPAFACLPAGLRLLRAASPPPLPLTGLIFFSAADRNRVTWRAAEAVAALAGPELHFEVVAPGAHPDHGEIAARLAGIPGVHVHPWVDDLPALAARCHFALGSGGVAMWERCCLGLPSLVVALTDDQRPAVAVAERAGAILSLGGPEISADLMRNALVALAAHPERRAPMAEAGRRLVDGLGAERLAATMMPMHLAPARTEDARLLWRWANDADVRRNSFSPGRIPWVSHLAWFERKLAAPDSLMLVARIDGRPVGQVRFDRNKSEAIVDVSLDPAWRGRGLAPEMLAAGVTAMRARWPGTRAVAQIKRNNPASRAAFLTAGFHEQSVGADCWVLDLAPDAPSLDLSSDQGSRYSAEPNCGH